MKTYMDCAVYRFGSRWIIRDLRSNAIVASYANSTFKNIDAFAVIRLYRMSNLIRLFRARKSALSRLEFQTLNYTMKTADQIRALMKEQAIDPILSRLEAKIETAAKKGCSQVEDYIATTHCSWETAQAVKAELTANGFTANILYIGDQRDSDCVKFEIKW